jgi:ParB-like chromosome segregation protein Spo0J
MKIELIKINKLKPAKYNPRQISKKQYEDLKESIRQFDLVDPIIVNKDMTVIGGHQRLKVCRELNFKDVDCVILDLSKEDERELNIRLNKNTGEFDLDVLANNFDMEELKDWGFKDIDFGLNIDKINPQDEWEGMPEFENEDLTPNKQIIISFKNQEDVDSFSKLIKQNITDKTKSLWFPKVENEKQFDKRYES